MENTMLSGRIIGLKDRLSAVQAASKLAAPHITLLAASKGQPAEIIEETIRGGITDFGENRVQEAQDKWTELRRTYPHVRLHLIGPLQSNKARQALQLFDVIQTLDRISLAEALANAMAKEQRRIPCYIQINTGEEPQKAGAHPAEADALIGYCRDSLALPITGLMCIPPSHQPPAPHFALLRQIALRHGLPELSMGMSADFETAVRLGASCVRLGRALFGEKS